MRNQMMPFLTAGIIFLSTLWLWNTFAPVVILLTPQIIEKTNGKITAKNITGYKIRNCQFIGQSRFGQVKTQGVWQEVSFEFLNELNKDSSKPLSWEKQSFGHWQWDISNYPKATKVRLVTFHDCHGKTIVSKIGAWEINEGE